LGRMFRQTQVQKANLGHPAAGVGVERACRVGAVPGFAAVAGSRWKRAPTRLACNALEAQTDASGPRFRQTQVQKANLGHPPPGRAERSAMTAQR
jgi:hypothetical protein